MDNQLQKTLMERIINGRCPICDKQLDLNRPKTSEQVKYEYHNQLGVVLVCISH